MTIISIGMNCVRAVVLKETAGQNAGDGGVMVSSRFVPLTSCLSFRWEDKSLDHSLTRFDGKLVLVN